jgi:hypothetical protein
MFRAVWLTVRSSFAGTGIRSLANWHFPSLCRHCNVNKEARRRCSERSRGSDGPIRNELAQVTCPIVVLSGETNILTDIHLPVPVGKLRILSHAFHFSGAKESPWPESASELCRPSSRRMSVKLVPTFADGRCCVVGAADPNGRILGFLHRSRYYFFQLAPQLYSRA